MVGSADVVIVGGGAAGLATAIFCKRHAPDLRVICLDGARRVGAKILVSGGSRCNVTNRVVSERDFWGGSPRVIRSVLRAFSAEQAAAFFREIGVDLHEEEDGKLFPDTNSSRTVLDSLLGELARQGVDLRCGERVTDVRPEGRAFVVACEQGREYAARAVVLATGGRSLPKSGSDGAGYAIATRLGHGLCRHDACARAVAARRRSTCGVIRGFVARTAYRACGGTSRYEARGCAPVDTFRCKRSSRPECVPSLASCAARRANPSGPAQSLPWRNTRIPGGMAAGTGSRTPTGVCRHGAGTAATGRGGRRVGSLGRRRGCDAGSFISRSETATHPVARGLAAFGARQSWIQRC